MKASMLMAVGIAIPALLSGCAGGAGGLLSGDEGEYRDGDEPNWRGFVTPNGWRYEGESRDGLPHGQGVLT